MSLSTGKMIINYQIYNITQATHFVYFFSSEIEKTGKLIFYTQFSFTFRLWYLILTGSGNAGGYFPVTFPLLP